MPEDRWGTPAARALQHVCLHGRPAALLEPHAHFRLTDDGVDVACGGHPNTTTFTSEEVYDNDFQFAATDIVGLLDLQQICNDLQLLCLSADIVLRIVILI